MVGAFLSVLYTCATFGYAAHPATDVTVSGTLWHSLVLYSFLAFGTVGVPVSLWLRYELRSPGVLLAGVLLFWHALVYVPPFGSGQGDAPGFLFVFVFVPVYLVAYGLLAAVEFWLRGRDIAVSLPST